MPFSARHRFRRGSFPALLVCCALVLPLAGCAEDRSNLIPQETSKDVIETLNEVDRLAEAGHCFKAQEVAASAQGEIEQLGGEIDPELKRSLIDGVVLLQGMLGDGEFCVDVGEPPVDEPVETEEDPLDTEGTTGVTGTTDPAGNTTGDQGETDGDQDSENPQGNGNDQTPTNPNPGTETNPTTPTNPTNPPPGPGSGGLGPG